MQGSRLCSLFSSHTIDQRLLRLLLTSSERTPSLPSSFEKVDFLGRDGRSSRSVIIYCRTRQWYEVPVDASKCQVSHHPNIFDAIVIDVKKVFCLSIFVAVVVQWAIYLVYLAFFFRNRRKMFLKAVSLVLDTYVAYKWLIWWHYYQLKPLIELFNFSKIKFYKIYITTLKYVSINCKYIRCILKF